MTDPSNGHSTDSVTEILWRFYMYRLQKNAAFVIFVFMVLAVLVFIGFLGYEICRPVKYVCAWCWEPFRNEGHQIDDWEVCELCWLSLEQRACEVFGPSRNPAFYDYIKLLLKERQYEYGLLRR